MHLSGFEKCDKDFCQNILTDEEKEDFYKMENTSSSSTITLSPPILSVRRGRRGGGKIIESPCALLLCVCVTLLIQSPLRTSAHLASFISSGKSRIKSKSATSQSIHPPTQKKSWWTDWSSGRTGGTIPSGIFMKLHSYIFSLDSFL